MEEHRFGEAADELGRYLREHPDDPQALLQLGICHLLNRSEGEFFAIRLRAERLLARHAPPTPEVTRLWALYRSLAAKVTTAALALGATATVGCDRDAPPTVVPETPAATATSTAPETPPPDEASPPADEAADTTDSPFATPPPESTDSAGTTAPTTTATAPPVRPAHRYSGGVRPPTKPFPAHRYSGGVMRN